MKKRFLTIALAGVICLTLIACNGGTSSQSPGAPSHSNSTGTGSSTGGQEGSAWLPTKSITILNPNSAGGGVDVVCRLFTDRATKMGAFNGQNLLVENMPGAGSMIGQTYVATTEGDGYLVLACTASVVNNPLQNQECTFTPDDFRWIGIFCENPSCVIVPSNSEISTVEDFVRVAKEKSLVWSTSGNGNSTHTQPLLMASQFELKEPKFLHQSSSADQLTQIMGGHADIASVTVAEAVSALESGQVKCIGLLANAGTRSDVIPDVTTFEEQGYPAYNFTIRGFAVAATTPDDVYEYLVEEFKTVIHDDEFVRAIQQSGNDWVYRDPDEMQAWAEQTQADTLKTLELLK